MRSSSFRLNASPTCARSRTCPPAMPCDPAASASIAVCSDCGDSSAAGSAPSSALSTRCALSRDQTGHPTSGFIDLARSRAFRGVGLETLEHSALQDLHLLLSVLERRLAILQELGA